MTTEPPIHLPRPFRILGHRGACGYAPENTFASFDLARNMYADALETDLHLTRDGVIVLFHDKTLGRVIGRPGNVADIDWADLSRFTVGGEGVDKFPQQRAPRIEAFLERYLRNIPLWLEIKAHGVIAPLEKLMQAAGDGVHQ